eukprot:11767452-Karenia_brevis.AAC.1
MMFMGGVANRVGQSRQERGSGFYRGEKPVGVETYIRVHSCNREAPYTHEMGGHRQGVYERRA